MIGLDEELATLGRLFSEAEAAVSRYAACKLALQETKIFEDMGIPEATTTELLKAPLKSISDLIKGTVRIQHELVSEWLDTAESRRELSELSGISRPTLSRWQNKSLQVQPSPPEAPQAESPPPPVRVNNRASPRK